LVHATIHRNAEQGMYCVRAAQAPTSFERGDRGSSKSHHDNIGVAMHGLQRPGHDTNACRLATAGRTREEYVATQRKPARGALVIRKLLACWTSIRVKKHIIAVRSWARSEPSAWAAALTNPSTWACSGFWSCVSQPPSSALSAEPISALLGKWSPAAAARASKQPHRFNSRRTRCGSDRTLRNQLDGRFHQVLGQ